jgi:hypothetical protein
MTSNFRANGKLCPALHHTVNSLRRTLDRIVSSAILSSVLAIRSSFGCGILKEKAGRGRIWRPETNLNDRQGVD